ncbi:hypothetical protein WUBG_02949 [Wuchereria bancrofti]|uniref:Uncharacterized protein n=1 Tax=Wuchereria bancrofti TaxID=6293 RepID=J9EU91_WUCBA|nr:hypothetical protein WUBG_02949 [Wuchereria bancrofti]
MMFGIPIDGKRVEKWSGKRSQRNDNGDMQIRAKRSHSQLFFLSSNFDIDVTMDASSSFIKKEKKQRNIIGKTYLRIQAALASSDQISSDYNDVSRPIRLTTNDSYDNSITLHRRSFC